MAPCLFFRKKTNIICLYQKKVVPLQTYCI